MYAPSTPRFARLLPAISFACLAAAMLSPVRGQQGHARQGAAATPQAHPSPPDLPKVSLRGLVTDTDHKPIAGAKVMLFDDKSGYGLGQQSTAADGYYTFALAKPRGTVLIDVSAPGYGDERLACGQSVLDGKQNPPTMLLLRADSFAEGVVIDTKDQPIAGATLTNRVHPPAVKTDAQGHFRLEGVCKRNVLLSIDDPRPGSHTKFTHVMGGRKDNCIRLLTPAEYKAGNARYFAERKAADNHGDGTPAATLLRRAEASARASGRSVFLTFHATWCGPCFELHEYLRNPQVKPIIDRYFVVQDIDIWERGAGVKWENPGGEALYQKYTHIDGVPFWVALRANGKVVGTGKPPSGGNMGMPSTLTDRDWFLNSLAAAAPRLTSAELDTLRKNLVTGE